MEIEKIALDKTFTFFMCTYLSLYVSKSNIRLFFRCGPNFDKEWLQVIGKLILYCSIKEMSPSTVCFGSGLRFLIAKGKEEKPALM